MPIIFLENYTIMNGYPPAPDANLGLEFFYVKLSAFLVYNYTLEVSRIGASEEKEVMLKNSCSYAVVWQWCAVPLLCCLIKILKLFLLLSLY